MTKQRTVQLPLKDGSELPVYVARPDRPGPHPGLFVMQEIFGVNAHIRDVTRRFAEQGYIAVAPELFHRTAGLGFEGSYDDLPGARLHGQAMTREGIGADLEAAYQFLQSESDIQSDRIAAVGFCMGGGIAILANALFPLTAAISFYGGDEPVLHEQSADLSGPMLFFWGMRDKRLDAALRKKVIDALSHSGKTFANVEFSDADHGFFNDQRSAYNPNAAREAWVFTLEFLKR